MYLNTAQLCNLRYAPITNRLIDATLTGIYFYEFFFHFTIRILAKVSLFMTLNVKELILSQLR